MKTRFLCIFILLFLWNINPAKSSSPPSDSYDRNSLSVVLVHHSDQFDAQVQSAFSKVRYGEKFDINNISTRRHSAGFSRQTASAPISSRCNEITRNVGSKYGREILSCWFNRKDNGTMDAELILKRGEYNATDADYLRAASTKVGTAGLGDAGFNLLNNSYLLFIDYTNIKQDTTKQGKLQWKTTVEAHLYRLDYSELLDAKVNECWIYDDDKASVKNQKIKKFESLPVGFIHVTSASQSISKTVDNGGLERAVIDGYDAIIHKLEKQVEAWKVRTPLYNVKPPRAKIGTKEGVRNMSRYNVYEYVNYTGKVSAKRKGVVRASRVAHNRSSSRGNSPTSAFYQIAGGRLEPGMTLVQNNDLGLGLGFGYRVGGMSGWNIKLDKLVHIHTSGVSHYILADITIDAHAVRRNISVLDSRALLPRTVTAVDYGLGYGLGLRPNRHFEMVPNFTFGMELLTSDLENENDEDDSYDDNSSWYFAAGMRMNVNIRYPFQLFAAADYVWLFSSGWRYDVNYGYLRELGKGRTKWVVSAGIRLNF